MLTLQVERAAPCRLGLDYEIGSQAPQKRHPLSCRKDTAREKEVTVPGHRGGGQSKGAIRA